MKYDNWEAVNGWILCQRKPAETTVSGLKILLSGSEYKNRELVVLAVSHPRHRASGEREQEHGPWVKPGDRVLATIFGDIAADPKGLEEDFVFLDHEEILAVLDPEVTTVSAHAPTKDTKVGF